MPRSMRRPLPSRMRFAVRVSRAGAAVLGLLTVSLLIGAVGYRELEGMRWVDAVYSAAMILTGMGPTMELKHDATKVFVTVYALFAGIVFLTSAALLLTPAAHRLLHRFHLEISEEGQDDEEDRGAPERPAARRGGRG